MMKPKITYGELPNCLTYELDGTIGGGAYKAAEAYEKFKIRLISWECAPLIENKF